MSSGSQTSLESAASAQTTSESNTLRGSGSPTHSISAHGPSAAIIGHVRSPSMPFASALGVVRYDKFDANEVKDLLVSFLYIVKHLHEGKSDYNHPFSPILYFSLIENNPFLCVFCFIFQRSLSDGGRPVQTANCLTFSTCSSCVCINSSIRVKSSIGAGHLPLLI